MVIYVTSSGTSDTLTSYALAVLASWSVMCWAGRGYLVIHTAELEYVPSFY